MSRCQSLSVATEIAGVAFEGGCLLQQVHGGSEPQFHRLGFVVHESSQKLD